MSREAAPTGHECSLSGERKVYCYDWEKMRNRPKPVRIVFAGFPSVNVKISLQLVKMSWVLLTGGYSSSY